LFVFEAVAVAFEDGDVGVDTHMFGAFVAVDGSRLLVAADGSSPGPGGPGGLLEALRRERVEAARRQGATWDQIGESLGMSRQSAWEYYTRTTRSAPSTPPACRSCWTRCRRHPPHDRAGFDLGFRRASRGRASCRHLERTPAGFRALWIRPGPTESQPRTVEIDVVTGCSR
jgi:hypothetical protein